MPQAASTPQSGVSLRTVHTGDLDPLQLVLTDFLKNQAKKKAAQVSNNWTATGF